MYADGKWEVGKNLEEGHATQRIGLRGELSRREGLFDARLLLALLELALLDAVVVEVHGLLASLATLAQQPLTEADADVILGLRH